MMSMRTSLLLIATLAGALAGCVERRPPWQLYGRAPCAEAEERVNRDREKIAALESSGKRPDDLAWHRDDLREASRALNACKNREAKQHDY